MSELVGDCLLFISYILIQIIIIFLYGQLFGLTGGNNCWIIKIMFYVFHMLIMNARTQDDYTILSGMFARLKLLN